MQEILGLGLIFIDNSKPLLGHLFPGMKGENLKNVQESWHCGEILEYRFF